MHVITDLDTGGAEMMLLRLISGMDRTGFSNRVVSLTDRGEMAGRIEEAGVPVETVGMRRGVPDPRGVWRLGRSIRRFKPDVVQTWMYHSDLIGGLAARLAGRIPVVWNIRQSDLSPEVNRTGTILTARACACLSGIIPSRIVCCSEASRRVHSGFGYRAEKMLVIPNGFDLDLFRPDAAARQSVRSELGLCPGAVLIGMVARFDPQKDHRNFVRAAGRLKDQGIEPFFVLCGEGVNNQNKKLSAWLNEAGCGCRFHLLGPRRDIPRLTAALDIACLSSSGEGFPNVLGEAMACGVPCVATDTGDAAEIVGGTGRIVPPKDPGAFAAALGELLYIGPEGRRSLGRSARKRIRDKFQLPDIIGRYESLYSGLRSEEMKKTGPGEGLVKKAAGK